MYQIKRCRSNVTTFNKNVRRVSHVLHPLSDDSVKTPLGARPLDAFESYVEEQKIEEAFLHVSLEYEQWIYFCSQKWERMDEWTRLPYLTTAAKVLTHYRNEVRKLNNNE